MYNLFNILSSKLLLIRDFEDQNTQIHKFCPKKMKNKYHVNQFKTRSANRASHWLASRENNALISKDWFTNLP